MSPAEHPILVFAIIDIPMSGTADEVTGNVETLKGQSDWVVVDNGASLGDRQKIRIGAGATLVVRFSQDERIEFRAAPDERWIELRIPTEH